MSSTCWSPSQPALTVPVDTLADSDAALLEVIKAGILPFSVAAMSLIFAFIAMIAITNTTLVQVVTQSRILYGMASEDVVPGIFAKIHSSRRSPWVALVFSAIVVVGLVVAGDVLNRAGLNIDIVERLAAVTVVLLLVVYAGVIISCFKLRGQDESDQTFRANSALLVVGLVGNLVLLYYVISTDPASLLWCAALIAIGGVLFVARADLRQPGPGRRAWNGATPATTPAKEPEPCTSSSPPTGASSRCGPPDS